jgi:hypothetical protein
MKVRDKIKLLQKERIQEIINDNSLSKSDKIRLLDEESLYGYASFIQHEFKKWEKEALELEKLEAERILKEGTSNHLYGRDICLDQFYQSKIIDYPLIRSNYVRYEEVSYCYIMDELEDYPDNELITVLTTRHPKIELKKTKEEIIDAIYNYAISNKIVGFKLDW